MDPEENENDKKKKGRKKKMKNRIIITNGVVKFKIVE